MGLGRPARRARGSPTTSRRRSALAGEVMALRAARGPRRERAAGRRARPVPGLAHERAGGPAGSRRGATPPSPPSRPPARSRSSPAAPRASSRSSRVAYVRHALDGVELPEEHPLLAGAALAGPGAPAALAAVRAAGRARGVAGRAGGGGSGSSPPPTTSRRRPTCACRPPSSATSTTASRRPSTCPPARRWTTVDARLPPGPRARLQGHHRLPRRHPRGAGARRTGAAAGPTCPACGAALARSGGCATCAPAAGSCETTE